MAEAINSTNPPDLLALAERCEREEPSRELDADIALTQGWAVFPGDNWIGPRGEICVPDYTSSLDAAVKLVPKGAWREGSGPRRYLNIPAPVPNYWHTAITIWEPMRDAHGWAATEAMSICVAALRAQAAYFKVAS